MTIVTVAVWPTLQAGAIRSKKMLKEDPRLKQNARAFVYQHTRVIHSHKTVTTQDEGVQVLLVTARGVLGTVRASQTWLVKQAVATLIYFLID